MNSGRRREDDEDEEAARRLLSRLAEERFHLAVVGETCRGKSTLINAILGESYLPTGPVPMTSVVTTVGFGRRPRAVLRRAGSDSEETALGNLGHFVADSGDERQEGPVVSADVEVPAEVLRLGLFFVDTPGVGRAWAANAHATRGYLPHADAVIFVTSFDAPLTDPEYEFLQEAAGYVEKMFLVVNKLDLVTPSERDEILAAVEERASAAVGAPFVTAMALSARQGLAAKVARDERRLLGSGLPDFEGLLLRLMAVDKTRLFLLGMVGRVEELITTQQFHVRLGVRKVDDDALRAFRTKVVELQRHRAALTAGLLLKIEHEWAERMSRQTSRARVELARIMGQGADHPPQQWFRRYVNTARRSLSELAAADLGALHRLPGKVGAAGAEVVGLEEPTAWAPRPDSLGHGLPPLLVNPPTWPTSDDASPSWRTVGPGLWQRDGGTDRRQRAIERMVVAYCEETERAVRRAGRAWAERVTEQVETEISAAADRFVGRWQRPVRPSELARLDDLARRLDTLRAEIARVDRGEVRARERLRGPRPRPMSPPGPADRLICVVCEQLPKAMFTYMSRAQFELATDERRQRQHAASPGFCPVHTWHYADIASDLGVAVAYAGVADDFGERLSSVVGTSTTIEELRRCARDMIPNTRRCSACRMLARTEQAAVAAAAEAVRTNPVDEPLPLLCLVHLSAVLAADPSLDRGRRLVQAFAGQLARSAEDLRGYALKRTTTGPELTSDGEEQAARRLLHSLVGHPVRSQPGRAR